MMLLLKLFIFFKKKSIIKYYETKRFLKEKYHEMMLVLVGRMACVLDYICNHLLFPIPSIINVYLHFVATIVVATRIQWHHVAKNVLATGNCAVNLNIQFLLSDFHPATKYCGYKIMRQLCNHHCTCNLVLLLFPLQVAIGRKRKKEIL